MNWDTVITVVALLSFFVICLAYATIAYRPTSRLGRFLFRTYATQRWKPATTGTLALLLLDAYRESLGQDQLTVTVYSTKAAEEAGIPKDHAVVKPFKYVISTNEEQDSDS